MPKTVEYDAMFVIKQCDVGCVICSCASPLMPNYYPIGRTPEEKLALKNLLRGHTITITGGDPLDNPQALEAIAELSLEDGVRRRVCINPISFAKMAPERRHQALDTLEHFEIAWSLGDLRGSRPDENREAAELVAGLQSERRRALAIVDQDPAAGITTCSEVNRIERSEPTPGRLELTGDSLRIAEYRATHLVGALRRSFETRTIDVDVHYPATLRKPTCKRPLEQIVLFFERVADEVHLHFVLCCGHGKSRYHTFDSGISVATLAGCEAPDELVARALERIHAEQAFHRLMTTTNNIPNFVDCAEQLLARRTGVRPNIMAMVPTAARRAHVTQCEACHAVGRELRAHGISPEEFHRFANEWSAQTAAMLPKRLSQSATDVCAADPVSAR